MDRLQQIEYNLYHILISTYHIILTDKIPGFCYTISFYSFAARQKLLEVVDIGGICLKLISSNGAR